MLKRIETVKCTHVVAQVSLGFYDADGNLVGEEIFPQGDGGVLVARIFHPHAEQLTSLIETCVAQAWEKMNASQPSRPLPRIQSLLGEAGVDQGGGETDGNLTGARP